MSDNNDALREAHWNRCIDKSQEIHSCSYYCDRPECIKSQRDELRGRMESKPEPSGERADCSVCAGLGYIQRIGGNRTCAECDGTGKAAAMLAADKAGGEVVALVTGHTLDGPMLVWTGNGVHVGDTLYTSPKPPAEARPAERVPLTEREIHMAWLQRDCINAIQAGDLFAQLVWLVRFVESTHHIGKDQS